MQFTIQRRQLRAILNFAAVKDFREKLKGVHVLQDHRGTILEATDGHALGMLRIDSSPKPISSCILPSASVKALLGSRKDGCLPIDFHVDGLNVTASGNGTVTTFQRIDGVFPDTQRVTPKESPEEDPAQFDVDLLVKFQQCAIDLEVSKAGFIGVRHRGPTNSALVGIGDDNFVGVIMPLRENVLPGIHPAWVHMQEKQEVKLTAEV